MAGEYDFSELRNYLMGQMALGETELFFDEPWTLTRMSAGGPQVAVPRHNPPPIPPVAAPVRPSVPRNPPPRFPTSAAPTSAPSDGSVLDVPIPPSANPVTGVQNMFGEVAVGSAGGLAAPAPRAIKRTISPYESAASLQNFYSDIKAEALYAKEPDIAQYMGPEHPKYLFLLPAVKPGADPAAFFQSPVGEMLVRLFASLNVPQEHIGVTYFFKSTERPLAPLLETALKKMLTKELSFIAPQAMVVFGQPLFHQLFGKAKNFDNLAGTDQDFAGVKTCCLVDPYAMVNDKQMKWLTWKVHIPRSTLFAK